MDKHLDKLTSGRCVAVVAAGQAVAILNNSADITAQSWNQ
jgi:hypothetical protein